MNTKIITAANLARLKKSRDIIAKERDKLRDLLHDVQNLVQVTEDGLELLDQSIDTFSQDV